MISLATATQTIKQAQDAVRCKCLPVYAANGNHRMACKDYLVDDLEDVLQLLLETAKKRSE